MSLHGTAGGGGGGGGNVTYNQVTPTISSMVTVTAVTAAPATTGAYTAFTTQACTELVLTNDTGVEIEYVRNGGTNLMSLRPGVTRRIVGITNANQISVRRSDWADASTAAVVPSGNGTRATTVSAVALTSTEVFAGATILNLTLVSGGGGDDLPAQACTGLEIVNNYGKAIHYRTGASAPYVRIQSGASAVVLGITNANQLHILSDNAVIDTGGRPVMVETFTSGLSTKLNITQPQELISAEATVMNSDMAYSSKMVCGPNLKMGEVARGPKRTLTPKKVQPLARFSTVANMTGSTTQCLDVTDGDIYMGTSQIEFTQTAFGTYNFAPTAVLTTGINVTGGIIRFTCSVPDGTPNFKTASALNSLKIQLFSAGTPAGGGANYHQATLLAVDFLNAGVSAAKRNFSFSIPLNKFSPQGTGADLTSIIWARFQLSTGSAGNGAKFRPVAIDFIPPVLPKAIVVFTFDDFHTGVWTGVLPALSKYNYPGVMFADSTAGINGGGLTFEQIRILHQFYGWQVANQNYYNDTGKPHSIEKLLADHSKFNIEAMAMGIGEIEDTSSGFATVTNIRDDNLPAIKRMYRSNCLFLNGGNATPPLGFPETAPFGDPYQIKRMNMSGYTAGTFYDRWKDHVDQAVAINGIALFAAHSEFNVGGTAEFFTALASLVEYIRTLELAGTVEVLTLAQAIDKIYPR